MKPLKSLALISALSLTHSVAHAIEDLTLVPSIAYQQKSLSFDQRYKGRESNQADFSTSLPMVNLSLTAAYKKFFVSAKFEKNIEDTPTTTKETDRTSDDQANLIVLPGNYVNVGREDFSLTFGYNVWKSMNVFVGYLSGETTLTPNGACGQYTFRAEIDQDDIDDNTVPFTEQVNCPRFNRAGTQDFLRSVGPSIASTESLQNAYSRLPKYQQVYKESGPFIGVSYNFAVKEYGNLAISLAYADMDGEYQDNARDPQPLFVDEDTGLPDHVKFNYEGDTTGTSLGITWTAGLGEYSAYFIDLRRQKYSMKGNDVTGTINFTDVRLETDETMTGLTAGIQFYY